MDEELKKLGAVEVEDEELLALGAQPAPTPKSTTPEMSPLEAFATTALVDGPFGFGDEIIGAAGAVASMPGSIDELKRLYNQYRTMAQEASKAAHEQYPTTSFAGSMAGGALIPGGMIAKGLGKGASLGQKMARGMDIGGRAGVITGLGHTEDITNIPQAIEDAALYGTGGAVLGGGVLPLAASTANATLSGIGHVGRKLLGPVKESFKMGTKGDLVVGPEAMKKSEQEITRFAKEIGPKLKSDLDRIGALKRKILKQADEMGVRVDEDAINTRINQALEDEPKSRLPAVRRELEELQELLRTYQQGKSVRKAKIIEIPTGREKVRQIEELKIAEQKAIESGVNPQDIDTVLEPVDVQGKVAAVVRQRIVNKNKAGEEVVTYKKLASRLIDEDELPQFKTKFETTRENPADLSRLPEVDQLRQDLAQKSKLGETPFQTPEVANKAGRLTQDMRDFVREARPQLEKVDNAISSLKDAAKAIGIDDTKQLDENAIMNRIISLIDNENKITASGMKSREQIRQFINHIKDVNPQMAQRISDDFDRLSEKNEIIKYANKQYDLLGLLATIRGGATAVSNAAGYKLHTMTKAPREVLSQIADDIVKTRPGRAAQELGSTIKRAAEAQDQEKNAILFGVMQNPAYRQILDKYVGPYTNSENDR